MRQHATSNPVGTPIQDHAEVTSDLDIPNGWPRPIESAQARWQAVNAPHLVALVRAGARFEHGELVERDELQAG
jgi:hypothetical protein